MRSFGKKWFALITMLILIVSLLPVSAFAQNGETDTVIEASVESGTNESGNNLETENGTEIPAMTGLGETGDSGEGSESGTIQSDSGESNGTEGASVSQGDSLLSGTATPSSDSLEGNGGSDGNEGTDGDIGSGISEGVQAEQNVVSFTYGEGEEALVISVYNAPDEADLMVEAAAGYEGVVKESLGGDFRSLFALDISLGNAAIQNDITVTITGESLRSIPANAKLLHILSGECVNVEFSRIDGGISFVIPSFSPFILAVPLSGDGTDCSGSDDAQINDYYVNWSFEWTNGSSGTAKNYEYKNPATGEADRTYLYFHPQSSNVQSANLGITVSFTGTQDNTVPEGAVEIRIPYTVFTGWDGIKADSVITQIPQAPATNNETFYNWYLDEETKEIVVKNWHEIAGNDYFHEEFTFQVDPLNMNGGYPDEEAARAAGYSDSEYAVSSTTGNRDIDRFCWNHNGEYLWKDYYTNTGINCTITIDTDRDGKPDYYDYKNPLSVAMITRAGGYMKVKPQPDQKQGVYPAWQSTWGTKPGDADQYVYVVWNVNYGRLTSAGSDQPWEIDVAYDETYPAITFGEGADQKVVYGEQVGEMMHTWTFPGVPNSENSMWGTLTVWGGDSSRGYYPGLASTSHNNTNRNHNYVFARATHALKYKGSSTGYSSAFGYPIVTPGDTWGTVHFAVLVRYPIDKIMEYAKQYGVNLETDGVKIYGRYTGDEKWESGYDLERSAVGVAELFIVHREGKGVFTKAVGPSPTTQGAQTALLMDYPVNLSFYNFDGFNRYAYYMSYDGTSPSSAEDPSKLLGQRIVITERQLMLSSGGAAHPKGWFPEDDENAADYYGNTILTDDDYTIPFFDVSTFRDYEGAYVANEWTEAGLYAYTKVNPIYVYIRYANTSEYIPYAAAKYSSSTAWSYYLVKTDDSGNPIMGEDGNPVLQTKATTTREGHCMLPEGVTGIRYEHETGNEVLKSVITVTIGVILKPTERVKEVIQADVDAGKNTYVKNIADCDVYLGNQDGSGYENTPWLDMDNYGNGTTVANNVIWTLTGSTNTLSLTKSQYVPKGDDPYQIEAGEKKSGEIAYIRLQALNESGISTNITKQTDIEDRFKLIKGTFFELLPKGTNPQEGSFFGIYNQTWSSHQPGPSDYRGLAAYKNAGRIVSYDGSRYFLSENDYTVSTEYIPSLDQYLVRIDYEFADPGITESPDHTWKCFTTFFFVLENSFENIRARGTDTRNYIAFMNTVEDGVSKPSSGSAITAANLDKDAAIAALFREKTEEADGKAVCAKITVPWNVVTALEANFNKMVATPETLNGIPAAEDYSSDGGVVTVGNRYIYRLQLTNMPTARADRIVFYDILESGTDDETSYWKGKFAYVDTSLISATPSDRSSTGATCAPVVYYSTKLTKKISLVDDQLTQETLFDLHNTEYWSATCPEDPSTVTAIAIDCTKASDGSDFHLGQKATLTAFIHMVAPLDLPTPPTAPTVNGAVVYTRPFDSIPGDIKQTPDELMSRAVLALRDTDVVLKKESDPKTGTPEARTMVDSDGTGTIVYRLTLRNTMPFDCNDIVITDPIPEFLTVDPSTPVTVKLNGSSNETDGNSTTGFSYELDEDGRSFTFRIAQQHPTVLGTDEDGNETVVRNKDTEIFIHTTVDKLEETVTETAEDGTEIQTTKQVFWRNYDNTATLESANGKTIGVDTDTMYHRAETSKVDVEKIWEDNEDFYKFRPGKILLNLKGTVEIPAPTEEDPDAVQVKEVESSRAEVKPDEDGNWSWSFEDLPKYYVITENADFETPNEWYEIKYTVSEMPVDNYTVIYDPTVGDVEQPDGAEAKPVGNTNISNVTITNKYEMKFGDLEITKLLPTYELSEPATFVFDIVGTLGSEENGDLRVVYSNVAVITLDSAGPRSTKIEHIPAGVDITVTEVYTGSHYSVKSDPEQTTKIQADIAVGVEFTNDYTTDDRSGHGIVNKFTYDNNGWHWAKEEITPVPKAEKES